MADAVMTPVFRVSYPNVFTPRKNDLNGKDEYSLVALFKKGEDLTKLRAAATAAIVKKWGENKNKWPKKMRSPFRDQAEREKENDDGQMVMPEGYEKGAFFLNLKSTRKPGCINQKNEPIIDGEEFYAGCWARATVVAFAYDNKGNQGVSFGLNNVQKYRDDDPLSSRRKAEEEFSPVEGGSDSSSTDDPFAD